MHLWDPFNFFTATRTMYPKQQKPRMPSTCPATILFNESLYMFIHHRLNTIEYLVVITFSSRVISRLMRCNRLQLLGVHVLSRGGMKCFRVRVARVHLYWSILRFKLCRAKELCRRVHDKEWSRVQGRLTANGFLTPCYTRS